LLEDLAIMQGVRYQMEVHHPTLISAPI